MKLHCDGGVKAIFYYVCDWYCRSFWHGNTTFFTKSVERIRSNELVLQPRRKVKGTIMNFGQKKKTMSPLICASQMLFCLASTGLEQRTSLHKSKCHMSEGPTQRPIGSRCSVTSVGNIKDPNMSVSKCDMSENNPALLKTLPSS